MPGRQQAARRPAVVVQVRMKTLMCLTTILVPWFAHTTTTAFTTRPETSGMRRGVKLGDDHRLNINRMLSEEGIVQPRPRPTPAASSSALHAVPPPPAAAEAAAQVVVDQVPAVHNPTLVSVLIPVAIAAVVYTIMFPDTSDNIRQFWEDQFEEANEGPLIVDYEPVELKPKYLTTLATNQTGDEMERDYVVSQKEEDEEPGDEEQEETASTKEVLASDKIRDFWEHEIVEKANKAPEIQSVTTKSKPKAVPTESEMEKTPTPTPTTTTTTSVSTSIPVIPKEASAQELTSLMSSVAESIKNGKDFDALIAERKRAAEFDEPLSDKIKQVRKSSKRRILQRAAKKAVMPWKKWDRL